MTTDPYGQYHSPYVGMGNNPISGFDPNGGWSWLGATVRWADSWLSGEDPGALRKLNGEWGFSTVSSDYTISFHFKGAVNWSQQWSNFQTGVPVWGSSRSFGNSASSGDYLGAASALGSTFAEAYTLGYGTLWGRAATLPMITKSTPIVEEAAKTGWKVGEPITNLTAKGNVPAWSTVRQRFWKNEASMNGGTYSESNLLRMQKGLAPQFRNTTTGVLESMELHHTIPQRNGGLFEFIKVTPEQHRLIDPFRR